MEAIHDLLYLLRSDCREPILCACNAAAVYSLIGAGNLVLASGTLVKNCLTSEGLIHYTGREHARPAEYDSREPTHDL